jgi:hypothetical protein
LSWSIQSFKLNIVYNCVDNYNLHKTMSKKISIFYFYFSIYLLFEYLNLIIYLCKRKKYIIQL